MAISEIRLQNVRSHELFVASLDPAVTLILGKNGAGKTSILEAAYYLLRGTSFRGRDRDIVAHASTRADMLIELSDGTIRRASIQEQTDGLIKKSFLIEGKTTARLPAKHRQPVVLFEPDELRSLASSPERRRRFFDDIISRLHPQYAVIIGRYQRTLLQRNELLKRRDQMPSQTWEDQLFVWDIKLAELAVEIVRQRREFIVSANAQLSTLYSTIANSEHHVVASYHSSLSADAYQQTLLNYLHNHRKNDSTRGYTGAGPHRDDILVTLDGHKATETASRGEMRTIMLAFKLLEVSMQQSLTSQKPLVLLDDVFSELDVHREQQLMQALSPYQAIITATDLRDSLRSRGTIIELP